MFGLLITFLLLVGLPTLVHHYWLAFHGIDSRREVREFYLWLGKGVAIPVIGCFLLNLGIGNALPPLWANWERAGGLGPWLGQLAPAARTIVSLWAGITFAWIYVAILQRTRQRREVVIVSAAVSIVSLPLATLALYFGGSLSLGWALLLGLLPPTHFTLAMAEPRVHRPLYSRAMARMKFGKYAEAEQEVLEQLERKTDDYEGWMMLAGLYANQFRDVAQADTTVRGLCDEPGLNAVEISIALNRLADWHLNLAGDPVAARSALELLCAKLPGSHFAKMARQRTDRLPKNQEELREQKRVKPIRLPSLSEGFDDPEGHSTLPTDRHEAAQRANRCTEKLRENPNQIEAREELAHILTEQLGRVDAGIEQVELLLGLPERSTAQSAEWLGLLASWNLRYRADPDAARAHLERLVREFPESPQAFAAQRRLNLIEMDERAARSAAMNASKARLGISIRTKT